MSNSNSQSIRIAVEGCGHGALDDIYASVTHAAQLKNWPTVDLVIICGDFQAVRNPTDLNTMSVPPKYRSMGDFWAYYSGERVAPYLTIFVGGNHEAAAHLRELYYGGWVAPNIYYLGAAGVVNLGGLRIAGMSGIYKRFDYKKGHDERVPLSDAAMRSAYHVREGDVRKLLQIATQVDVGISHDWPDGIEWLGDHEALFRRKPHFQTDARKGELGSKPATYVLERLRPRHWFSGHMHVKYVAIKRFDDPNGKKEHTKSNEQLNPAEPAKNEDEIDLDDLLDDKQPETSTVSEDLRAQLPASFSKAEQAFDPQKQDLPYPSAIQNTATDFLALSKILPNHEFLQLLELTPFSPAPKDSELIQRPLKLRYDPEWLAILRTFKDLDPARQFPLDPGTAGYRPQIDQELSWVQSYIIDAGKSLVISENFKVTAPVWREEEGWKHITVQPREYSNPQTESFCDFLGIKNYFHEEEDVLIQRHEQGVRNIPGGYSGRGHNYRGRGRGRGRGYVQGRGRGGAW